MSKRVRVFYFILFTVFIFGANYYISGTIAIPKDENMIWFQAGFLTLLISLLFSEFQYTKPIDVFVTTISLFFSISSYDITVNVMYWNILKIILVIFFILALILFIQEKNSLLINIKLVKVLNVIVKDLGSSKIICTLTYILAIWSL